MATKKQKREAAMKKREEFLAEVKADGLKALKRDQEYRTALDEAYEKKASGIIMPAQDKKEREEDRWRSLVEPSLSSIFSD